MTRREFKYHYTVRWRSDLATDVETMQTTITKVLIIKRRRKPLYRVIKYKAHGYDATILQPNFGMFTPFDIARNPNGTPKLFDTEKVNNFWCDEHMMCKESGTNTPAAGTPVTITIIKDNHYNGRE